MRKSFHRAQCVLALLLSLCLLLALVPTAALAEGEDAEAQQTIHLATAQDLLDLAENCRLDRWSQNRIVVLDNDIDLAEVDFSGIPTFGGTFEGQNHALTGLTLTGSGSNCGLFRYLQRGAVVRDLNVGGRVMPVGTRSTVGGVAGSNAGTLQNCTFSGVVTGASRIGGLVGSNETKGVITGCKVSGIVYGEHFIGGVAGVNHGVITGCGSEANVNTTVEQNTVELVDLTLEDLTGTETATDVTDIGGITGSNDGVLRACTNHGTVGYQHVGYNVGGIAGSQTGYIEGCVNYGAIHGRKEAGGIVGQLEPSSVLQYSQDTLQTLQGQLATLQSLTDKACNDAEATSSDLTGQLNSLQGQVDGAKSAVETLLEQLANGVSLGTTTVKTDLSDLFPQNAIHISSSGPEPTPVPTGEAPLPTSLPEITLPTLPPLPTAEPDAATPIPVDPAPTPEPAPEPTPEPGPEENEPGPEESEQQPGDAPPAEQAEHGRPAHLALMETAYTEVADIETENPLPTLTPETTLAPLPTLDPETTPGPLPTLPPDVEQQLSQALNDAALPSEISVEIPSVEITNQDGISAARSGLSGNLSGIVNGVSALNSSSAGNAQALIEDLRAITNQINRIGDTLAGAVEKAQDTTAGDIVQDVSDSDTEQDTEGKIDNCINAGAVQADLNAGGIAGAMAPENDLDPEDDVQISGSNSLNFTYKTRAVLRSCVNHGTVTVKKQNAGGIVGMMDMGTVWQCENLGTLDAADADNVGGIAGKSGAAIRESSAKCTISGANNVGGIAGVGKTLRDCRAMVRIAAGQECLGAIAGTVDAAVSLNALTLPVVPDEAEDTGSASNTDSTDDTALTGNYFVAEGLGGIDNVSYAGRAEALDYDDFVGLENLPDEFKSLTVRFVADGTTIQSFSLNYGEAFPQSSIPAVPPKDSCTAAWDERDLNRVTFDETVEAVYTPLRAVLESAQQREGRAILLAEGTFGTADTLSLTAVEEKAALVQGESWEETWNFSLPDDGAEAHTVRYLAQDAGHTALYLKDGDGWRKVETVQDGSYLKFELRRTDTALCAAQTAPNLLPLLCTAGGAAVVLVLLALRHRRKARNKTGVKKAQ